MAQVVTTFELFSFNPDAAAAGALCVAANQGRDISDGSSKKYITSGGEHFYGAGTCKKNSSGHFIFTAKGEACIFTATGKAHSSNAKTTETVIVEGQSTVVTVYMQLFIAKVHRYYDVKQAGSAITTQYSTTVTKSSSGITTVTTADLVNLKTIVIDTLTPRDQFAIQALRGIMEHIDNPAGADLDNIQNYCRMAYKWAEGMMQAAADVRSAYTDETQAQEVDIDKENLESNTEKILYNITADIKNLTDAVTEGFESLVENNSAE